MIIRVKHKDKFTTILNNTLQDSRLSYRARGILAYLLSKPDNWKANISDIAKNGEEGQRAVRTAIEELDYYGYFKSERKRNEDGQYEGYETYIFEYPKTYPEPKNPDVDNPEQDSPNQDNGTLTNKDSNNKRSKQRKNIDYTMYKKAWNNNISDEISQIRKMSPKRKNKLRKRIKEGVIKNIEEFKQLVNKINNSSFLKGDNDRNWKVDFDWVIRNSNNAVKILEGKYEDKEENQAYGFN